MTTIDDRQYGLLVQNIPDVSETRIQFGLRCGASSTRQSGLAAQEGSAVGLQALSTHEGIRVWERWKVLGLDIYALKQALDLIWVRRCGLWKGHAMHIVRC